MEWYHCGRCGSLFRSPPGDADERVCAKCGRDPSLGVEPPDPQQGSRSPQTTTAKTRNDETGESRERHESRRTKRNSIVAKLVIGWTLFMALIVIAVKLVWPESNQNTTRQDDWAGSIKGSAGDEEIVNIDQALPSCAKNLSGFLNASAAEQRAQFVTDPMATATRMAHFQNLNPMPRVDPETLRNTENSLLNLPGHRALESRWETPDGTLLDCVFIKTGDEWLLDWDHFVRYQEYPWALFTAGEGPDEAEFRLLVRQRVIRSGDESIAMDLVFSPSRFGRPRETGQPAVEIIIRRDSSDGRLLTAGFKQRSAGTAPFDSKLKPLEQEDMLRVRVRLRRTIDPEKSDGSRKYELVKVEACHWLNTTDPGVE